MSEEAAFSDQSEGGNEEVGADDDDDVVRSDDLGEEEEDDFVFVSQKKRKPDSGTKKRSSKPKRSRLSGRNFMDVEAAVGDDDDDEDDYNGDDDGEFIREADEAQLAERELDLAHRRRLYRSFDASEEARGAAGHLASAIGNIERRYQEQRYTEEDDALAADDEDQVAYGDYEARGEDPTRFLADVKDSKLWVIRTAKSVPEREVVISIMNKFVHMSKEGKPFPVLSAFAPDGIRGYIYVEADNPGQVREALRGFRNVFLNHMKMVAVKEMSSVYTMGERDVKPLTRHELVRVKGGLYAGDLAQVTDLEEHNSSAWIRLVPRINLANYFEQKKKNQPGEPMRRPVARLLTREEIEAKGGEVDSGMMRSTFRFDGKLFEETGYLLRKIRPHHLITGPDVNATLQELKEFGRAAAAEAGESGEAGGAAWQKLLSALPAARRGAYALGDAVIVNAGDLAGLRGTVVSVEERAIGVQPLDKTLHNVVSVAPNDVVKYFEIGDSVKAVSGVHSGISGLVTSVDLKTKAATVFAPALGRPITCVLDHLQTCPNCGVETVSSLGGFNVADLVQSSEQVTGVIIRIDPGGALSVLTTEGRVEHVPLSGVATKRSNDFALALDRNNVQFGVRAAVTDTRGVAGRVAHIWKRHVFVRLSSKDAGHNGFMVCDSKELKVSAADGAPVGSSMLVGGTPGSRAGFVTEMGGRGGPPSSFGGQRSGGGGFRGGRGGGRQWVGQRVRVISGRNKGSFGEILSCESGGRLRIRLSQNDHTICLGKDELIILGQNSTSGGPSFRSATPRGYSNQRSNRSDLWDSEPPASGPHEGGTNFANSRRRVDTPAPESHSISTGDPLASIWDSPTEPEAATAGSSATDTAPSQKNSNLPAATRAGPGGTTNQTSSSWTAYFQSVRERPEVN